MQGAAQRASSLTVLLLNPVSEKRRLLKQWQAPLVLETAWGAAFAPLPAETSLSGGFIVRIKPDNAPPFFLPGTGLPTGSPKGGGG